MTQTAPIGRARRIGFWAAVIGVPLLAVALAVVLAPWDWLIPLAESRAAAALGRPVSITHLRVQPGRLTHLDADDVTIGNPTGFDDPNGFAHVNRIGVDVDVFATLRQGRLVLPVVVVDTPRIAAIGKPDGRTNYRFEPANTSSSPGPAIVRLSVLNGQAHVQIATLATDMQLEIATDDEAARIKVTAKGTYARQPITGTLLGGTLLSLQNITQPYPIDLQLANGPTKISLVGTINDPLALAGVDLKLSLTGPDMALLLPLTGIALPKTPNYRLTGKLDYANKRILFRDFAGTVGSSDLGGTITIDPAPARPDVTAVLHSRQVDLEDLGGLIGSEPGRTTTPNQTDAQRQALARAEASSKLFPNTPLNMPKLRMADIHLTYRGDKILGRNSPFDTLTVTADIVDGAVTLHPAVLGIGTGTMTATITLTPQANDDIKTKADVKFQRLDVSRMLEATHLFQGSGRLGGQMTIDTTGNSIAAMLAAGEGSFDLFMSGGALNAFQVDLSGLHFGSAVLSAIGIPAKARVDCLIGQFGLHRGVLSTKTMLVDTSEAVIHGTGTIDLAHETIDYSLKTDVKHFTVGSLPAPIGITGPFKDLSIGPDIARIGLRGGAAAGLGFVFPPLALLPLIQFGVGDENLCGKLLK